MKRATAVLLVACAPLLSTCATEGGGGAGYVDVWGTWYYDDYWYAGGGCCVDYPGDIGPPPPRPTHPIALPPAGSGPRPENPIANPTPTPKSTSSSRPTSSSSMSAPRGMSRGGGGGGRGGGGRR